MHFEQDCIPVGCVPSAAVAVSGVGGLPGGCLPRRCTPPDPEADTPPPVNRITDTCKMITFPQLLLRTVKMLQLVGKLFLVTSEVSHLRSIHTYG